MKYTIAVALILLNHFGDCEKYNFPDKFKFGVATASYQIEGGKCDGKGETIWDRFINTKPDRILEKGNSDIACDSYHKYKEDVANLKNLGVHFYRFSLSWSRILPKGYLHTKNEIGIDYYRSLIKELKYNNIEPYVTLYHWDLPQALQDIGGWLNPSIIDHFSNYARFAFKLFGDDVKIWFTFNEPKQTCLLGYGTGQFAPGFNESGIYDYMCSHNVIKAHAHAYHIYDKEFRPKQQGKISFVVDSNWFEPASSDPADIEAAERMLQFTLGWYANPVYHKNGNYPQIMIDRIQSRSRFENYEESRLPTFTNEEIEFIRGTYDFFSLNTYTTFLAESQEDNPAETWFGDAGVHIFSNSSWEPSDPSAWLRIVPWGIRKLLAWIDKTYDKPDILITENGFYDDGRLKDYQRIDYIKNYLINIHHSIFEDKVTVIGYTVWSLMDNFEWLAGYKHKFGLYHVDFSNVKRNRTIKASGEFYKDVIAKKSVG